MKKWKILIPSLVATASMPLVGLVGCNKASDEPIDWGTVYQLDTKWEYPLEAGPVDSLSTSEPISLKAGEKYTFVINLKDWTADMDEFEETWTLRFWIEDSIVEGLDVDFESIMVWRNGTRQKNYGVVPTYEEGLDGFVFSSVFDEWWFLGVCGYHWETPPLMTDEYKIQFVVNSDVDNLNVFFTDFQDLS